MSDLILKNAIDSISMGLEDFQLSEKDERRITSCTRNILSGILLLFKYKLAILSPKDSDEVLIKKEILPILDEGGKIVFRGSGRKTVDVHGIKNRFKSLGIQVSWNELDEVIKYRNEIEHYYTVINIDSAKTMVSESFIIIKGFIENELKLKPESLFNSETWLYFANTKQVHNELKKECNSKLEKLDYYSIDVLNAIKECKCENCGSDLISAADECDEEYEGYNAYYICKACNRQYNYEEIIELYLDEYMEHAHELIKDGEESNITYCPSCGKMSYLYNEELCLLCGESIDNRCVSCGQILSPDEIGFNEYCSCCLYNREQMMKDD